MSAVAVRYRVHPEHAEANAALVRAVYDELTERAPEGFRYATFVEADGVSFVHLAVMAEGVEAPLPGLEAFRTFRAGLGERCAEGPVSTALTPVGGYGWGTRSAARLPLSPGSPRRRRRPRAAKR